MENQTAKNFVLQLGSLASLYLSLSFLLVLLFGIINLLLPDSADSVWEIERASSSIRIGIAMVLVFFPTYLALTRMVNQTRRKNQNGSYLGLTKWLIYLSLLVGGAVLLGDLVALIMSFLEGELTQRFLLKAFAVLVVVGTAFEYYLLDAKGHWVKSEKNSLVFAGGASVVVLLSLIVGFMNIELPTQVREQKIDTNQISDLQDIQWRIQDYLAINETLPESLSDLTGKVPEAPETRTAYVYTVTENGFNLCATFESESNRDDYYYGRGIPEKAEALIIVNPDNWEHSKGEVCFERIVRQ